jgi:hypothetical protein
MVPRWGAYGVVFIPLGALGCAPPCLAQDLAWELIKLGFHKISLTPDFPVTQPFLADDISPTFGPQIRQIRCLR